ncbi:MAG TPA: site-specific DNA-methyltransferase [Candidatus Paceibacterota bacterium]
MFLWLYTQNQMKAMGVNHFIEKLELPTPQKETLKERLNGWKTPQVKSCFEPIVMAQKPTDGTYLSNMQKHGVGLVNTHVRIGDGMFPANVSTTERIHELLDRVFLLSKPSQEERGAKNIHETVKPLALCRYLISLTAFSKNAVVLDPFVGSGTTAVAAKRLGKQFIGFDINRSYVEIARRRLKENDARSSPSDFIPISRQARLLV